MTADSTADSTVATEQVLLDLLRPTLEWAVGQVRRDKSTTVPRSLRPMLRFTKLPPNALRQTYRSIESDDQFRAHLAKKLRAAKVAPVDGPLGRLGALWIERDDGWEDAFERLVTSESRRLNAVKSVEAEDDLERRVVAAEALAAEADEARSIAVAEAVESQAGLEARSADLEAAEATIAELSGRIDELETARAEAIRQLKAAESLAQRRLDDYRSLESDRAAGVEAGPAAPSAPAVDVDAMRSALITMRAELAVSASAIDAAQAAVEQAHSTLDAPATGVAEPPSAEPPPAEPASDLPPETSRPNSTATTRRRRPVTLPGGLGSETVKAAEHLARTANVVLLVDGYNQSMYRWSQQPIATQREVLVQRLSGLAARTGASVDLVFDGDEPGRPSRGSMARGIRVRFSPAEVEADDVIIELCATYNAAIPLVVASDDRRVRAGAEAAGANVITGQQLHALLG